MQDTAIVNAEEHKESKLESKDWNERSMAFEALQKTFESSEANNSSDLFKTHLPKWKDYLKDIIQLASRRLSTASSIS